MTRPLTPKQEAFCREYLISLDRFWGKVAIGVSDECWNWTAAKDRNGYGRFHVGKSHNSAMLAHRVAYGLATGESPEAVCHRCDNPSCCNPSHLFGGSRADNNRDMAKKGRHWLHINPGGAKKGEKHHYAKLNDTQVIRIREMYERGGYTQRGLASEFGVCQRTITKIVKKIGWSHV
jgi:hypothetical protein